MKIEDSQVAFITSRKMEETRISKKHLDKWVDPSPVSISKKPPLETNSIAKLFSKNKNISPTETDNESNLDPDLMTMKRMLENLTGKKIRIRRIDSFKKDTASSLAKVFQESSPPNSISSQRSGWGILYSEFQSYYESEETILDTMGTVKTGSGETMNFSLHLKMQREFYTEDRFEFSAGDALTDPLVINFSGKPAGLRDVRFQFDIDSDGKKEEIPWLAPGNGFLVFDKDSDGIINNGSELFGPQSGNGFEELAALDMDGNGWIDENDPEFDYLSIWSGEGWDSSCLTDLKQGGIGAISLSNTETQFSIKDQTNHTLGKIRRTGIYIREEGNIGSIQQVDLAV